MAPPPSADRGERNAPKRRRLRFALAIVVVLALLVGLNAFVLDHETGKARQTVPGAELVATTSGPLQVLDTGAPADAPDGLPLVLLHGLGGSIGWWDGVLPRLSDGHRVLAIDLLGHGGSAKPDSGYSIESQASLVAQVLDRLGVARAVLVGHSLGGNVAVALGQGSPRLVAGVVLIDTSPDNDSGGLGLAARATLVPVAGPLIWRLAPDSMRRRSLSRAFAPGADLAGRYLPDLEAMTYPAYRASSRAGRSYTDDSPLPVRLQGTGLPLMVIFGEEDRIFPAREALSAYAGVPGVETVLVPGSGHSPQVEAPARTTVEILRFTRAIERNEALRARAVRERKRQRARDVRERKRRHAKAAREGERKPEVVGRRNRDPAASGGKQGEERPKPGTGAGGSQP